MVRFSDSKMKQMLQEFLMKGLELDQLSHLSDNSIVAQIQTDCIYFYIYIIYFWIYKCKNPKESIVDHISKIISKDIAKT